MLLLEAAAAATQQAPPQIWETWQFWVIGLPIRLLSLFCGVCLILLGIFYKPEGAIIIG